RGKNIALRTLRPVAGFSPLRPGSVSGNRPTSADRPEHRHGRRSTGRSPALGADPRLPEWTSSLAIHTGLVTPTAHPPRRAQQLVGARLRAIGHCTHTTCTYVGAVHVRPQAGSYRIYCRAFVTCYLTRFN